MGNSCQYSLGKKMTSKNHNGKTLENVGGGGKVTSIQV